MHSLLFCVTLAVSGLLSRAAPAELSAGANLDLPYIGCFEDSASSRLLNERSFSSPHAQSVLRCITNCTMAEYPLAGVEYGSECYCDYAVQGFARSAPVSECNKPCTGSIIGLPLVEKCGGDNRIMIYSTSIIPPANKPRVDTFYYQGCYTDTVSSRTLSDGVGGEFAEDMTVEKCLGLCKGLGKSFAVLEYSKECFCGDSVNSIAVKAPEEDCHKTCTGNRQEFCGGPARITIYHDSG